MKITHLVLKKDDIEKYLTEKAQEDLRLTRATIAVERVRNGKTPFPSYIVINTDEPYIKEIIDVLKRNGHWDEEVAE